VATDIPANRAWVESGKNGLLFPSGDSDRLAAAIIEAIRKPQWRQEVIPQNFEIIRSKASWSASMEKIEGYYDLLINKKFVRVE
jgi:glycosyltransferase involved in cell wall biosynthesis